MQHQTHVFFRHTQHLRPRLDVRSPNEAKLNQMSVMAWWETLNKLGGMRNGLTNSGHTKHDNRRLSQFTESRTIVLCAGLASSTKNKLREQTSEQHLPCSARNPLLERNRLRSSSIPVCS